MLPLNQSLELVQKLLLIAIGGALGSVLRYLLSGLAQRMFGESFPWGTLVVNVLGCFLIGLLWAFAERAPLASTLNVFAFTGVLGAFTTFSTYGLESFNLLRDGDLMLGLGYMLTSNVIGIGAVIAGFFMTKGLLGPGGTL